MSHIPPCITRRRLLRGATGAALAATLAPPLAPDARAAAVVSPRLDAWAGAGQLRTPRAGHTATLLRDGTILVVGGGTATAERYDPATYMARPVAPLSVPRTAHTATLLPDGTVLVAGGHADGPPFATAERYDPATDHWSPTGMMGAIRSDHTATPLPDGTVLVAGGFPLTVAAERYNPRTDSWLPVAPTAYAHGGAVAAVLPDGRVAAFEGGVAATEVYDPAAAAWTTTHDETDIRDGLDEHAVAASYGDLLVVGGILPDAVAAVGDAWQYEIAVRGSRFAVGSLRVGRHGHTATALPNGGVLVVGGSDDANPGRLRSLASVERYNPGVRQWLPAPSLGVARRAHTATALPGGSVAVIGGYGAGNAMLSSVETFL